MATTSGSNKNGNSNTVKTVKNPSSGVTFASQGATNSEWNDYIISKGAELESKGKKVYYSMDETGSLHYSTTSQKAANNTAGAYDTSLSSYTNKDNKSLSILDKKTKKENTDQVNGNKDSGGSVLASSSDIQNSMYTSYQNNPSLNTTNPFGFITNQKTIKDLLDDATNAAYVTKEKEAKRGLVDAENTAYANTNNAINDLRRSLAGSAVNGANRGSAAATALQSLLGLGQQNNELVTTGLQNIIDVADQKAAALAQNASDSIDISNNAKNLQSNSATSVYSSDATMWSELTSALSSLTSSLNTDSVNKTMNDDTNATNKEITKLQTAADKAIANINANATIEAAKKGQTQNVNYSGGYAIR